MKFMRSRFESAAQGTYSRPASRPHKKKRPKPESVASILERETDTTIQNWLDAVERDAELTCVP